MAQHYVIVLVPQQGGWRAHFSIAASTRAPSATCH